MASSPPPPPFPITPKPDPDGPLFLPQNHLAAALEGSLALTPELCDALHRELAPSPDDDPAYAQFLIHGQTHLQALAAQLRHAAAAAPQPHLLLPPPEPEAEAARSSPKSAGSVSKTKRARPPVAEMVRATNLSHADQLHFRGLVRRARLAFAALLGICQRQKLAAGRRNRVDLRASSKMLSAGHWLHREHRIVGHVPGVHVGDAFLYRAELCVVGLHAAPQAGIAYIPGSAVTEVHPVATSIVSSGGYLDDEDAGDDVLIYTGSGGRERNRLDHHADQKLQGGNLALHNSYVFDVEVRVIRGHACDAVPNRKVYVYDGLYKVVSSDFGAGKSGHDVCKFKLVRLPGQDDQLGSKNWNTANLLKHAIDSKILPPRYISLDLSAGKEPISIPVCNMVDDDRSPLDFEYIVSPDFSVLGLVKQEGGCHCAAVCGLRCECTKKNVGGPVYNEDGTLVRGRPVVYECGALCGCPITCLNRVTQRGMKHRLEVFRSSETEWGVRTLDLIQPGAFVCEYSGEVVVMGALREDRSIIDPNKRFPPRWSEWGDASSVDPSIKGPQFHQFPGAGYMLDVSNKRSVACYINHSDTPNVFIQYVLHGNEEESCPHLMVFAMETIPPMRELNIAYGMP